MQVLLSLAELANTYGRHNPHQHAQELDHVMLALFSVVLAWLTTENQIGISCFNSSLPLQG